MAGAGGFAEGVFRRWPGDCVCSGVEIFLRGDWNFAREHVGDFAAAEGMPGYS